MTGRLRLGVNVDHVATVRNARGNPHPDPLRAARIAAEAGADGITAHLREDRRHIRDDDMRRLRQEIPLPLNFEMAPTGEMVRIALAIGPHAACLVPERREELTTEGGLDVAGLRDRLRPLVRQLGEGGVRVSMFIEPDPAQVEASRELGAPVVELHTGRYCESRGGERERELARIREAAALAARIGLEPHAGHGLDFETVGPIAAIGELAELNIGHFLVGEAIFTGLDAAVRKMRALMDEARGAMIVGIGSDLIDIRRIERTLERFGERFLARVFTEQERRRCERRLLRAASYARRYAAKEACSKALGTGFRKGVYWRDMGVVNLPGGQPTMALTGGAAARLDTLLPANMAARIDLTITDEPPIAQAMVIITAVPAADDDTRARRPGGVPVSSGSPALSS